MDAENGVKWFREQAKKYREATDYLEWAADSLMEYLTKPADLFTPEVTLEPQPVINQLVQPAKQKKHKTVQRKGQRRLLLLELKKGPSALLPLQRLGIEAGDVEHAVNGGFVAYSDNKLVLTVKDDGSSGMEAAEYFENDPTAVNYPRKAIMAFKAQEKAKQLTATNKTNSSEAKPASHILAHRL